MNNNTKLKISVITDQCDENEEEKLSKELVNALNELDEVISIEFLPTNKTPDASKGLQLDWSSVLLVLLSQSGQIWGLLNALTGWLMRDRSRSLELSIGDSTLKLTGISKEEQQKLVEWYQIQTGISLKK